VCSLEILNLVPPRHGSLVALFKRRDTKTPLPVIGITTIVNIRWMARRKAPGAKWTALLAALGVSEQIIDT
jgi:hypothetical protein